MKNKQTISGLIRDRLPDIEQKMMRGFRQESIVAEFEVEGYSMSLGVFRTELYRARKFWSERDNEKQAKSLREQPKTRPTTDRQGQDIPKPENAPKTGNIRNPGKIDKSELF